MEMKDESIKYLFLDESMRRLLLFILLTIIDEDKFGWFFSTQFDHCIYGNPLSPSGLCILAPPILSCIAICTYR